MGGKGAGESPAGAWQLSCARPCAELVRPQCRERLRPRGSAQLPRHRCRRSQQPRERPAGPGLTGPGAEQCHRGSAAVRRLHARRVMPTPEADPKSSAGRRGLQAGATGAALRGPREGRWLPPGAAHSCTVSQGGGCEMRRPAASGAGTSSPGLTPPSPARFPSPICMPRL